ncbi:MAG: glycine--tRNA ligase subunit beta, partial [Pseudomonadota bacterium]
MAEFLLEIRSEEIPARMQVRAGADLRRMLEEGLKEAGLSWLPDEGVSVFTGPRRIGLAGHLPDRSPDVREERKGPRVGSPEKALQGFMRGAGLSDISEAEIRSDKKGEHYVAIIEKPGRDAADILAELIPSIMADFPWPKSMKSGGSAFRWVRPLRGIIAMLDDRVIPFEVGGIESGNVTYGHRQMGYKGAPITVGPGKGS